MADRLSPQRLPSGIRGLDAVLGGGFAEGRVYVLQGMPGSGKTILANQIVFHQAHEARRAVYVTLAAESHDQMLQNLASLGFADTRLVPDPLFYVNGFQMLIEEGIKGFHDLLRDALHRFEPSVLVIDGLHVIQEYAECDREFRRFLYALQGDAALRRCAILLIINATGPSSSPEHTVVDGILELGEELFSARAVRSLIVHKFRGSPTLPGRHLIEITGGGLQVWPRLETLPTPVDAGRIPVERVGMGIPKLDAMMGGGPTVGSTTLVAGPAGSGKTSCRLMFMGRCSPAERGILLSCYEAPGELMRKARGLGIDLEGLCASGAVRVLWYPRTETLLDEMAHTLLDAVRGSGARRVFIDGAGALGNAAVFDNRNEAFFTALTLLLRAEQATMLCTAEARDFFLPELTVQEDVASVAENVVLLRYAEKDSTLRRLLSVIKMRHSAFDAAIRPFVIDGRGVIIDEESPSGGRIG